MWMEIISKALLVLLLSQAYFSATNAQDLSYSKPQDENAKTCFSSEELEQLKYKLLYKIGDIINEVLAQERPVPPTEGTPTTTHSPPNDTQQSFDLNDTCHCSDKSRWNRVASLNMTDPYEECPSNLREVNFSGLRACGRQETVIGCESITYPVHGVQYSRVCGRIIGYQFGSPDAFHAYNEYGRTSIDDYYVDGVRLTHGTSPRSHIWTFAAAVDEARFTTSVCPCSNPHASFPGEIPPFVGQDYFCETGTQQHYRSTYYPDEPLWDGQGCGSTSTCCSFNNPQWFCKQLPEQTTEDIELSLCLDEHVSNEDVLLETVEIYVQ